MDEAAANTSGSRTMSRLFSRDLALEFLKHVPSRLMQRSDDDDDDDKECHTGGTGNTCEKSLSPNVTTVAIACAVVIPVVAILCVLFYLHRRNVRRTRAEDAKARNLDLDFGLNDHPRKKGRKSLMVFGGEKLSHKNGQLSMDMNLASPYLLPPGLHGSQDSIHSLVRTMPIEADPYRPIAHYTNSDSGSIRSYNKDGGSMYNGYGNKRASVVTGRSIGTYKTGPPPRVNSIPRSPVTDEKVDPFATPNAPARAHHAQELDSAPAYPAVPEIDSVAYPDEKHGFEGMDMPDIQPPPRALSRNSPDAIHSPPTTQPPQFELPAVPQEHAIGMAHDGTDSFNFLPDKNPAPAGLGLNLDLPHAMSRVESPLHSPPPDTPSSLVPGFGRPLDSPTNQPQIHTSEYLEEERGRSTSRQSVDFHVQQQGGLGVPQQNNKRLSVGARPLPPDDITDSEDPEYRANRIRSFYKEYFDDSKEAVPPMPTQHGYYEDYDQGYGDAAYYDADSNAFVMPYAQPVTRRAMTPPPAGRRGPPGPGPGPRGPRRPRGPNGSMGGMSSPGGQRRPRAGSAFGGPNGGYNSRAASSLGPRPDSSASGGWGRPKKNLPPPKDLTTLPAPSKLRDDSFALMGAIDFAPPDSFREHVSGRSQSPLGERRPYQPQVPVASPLVTAFDELAALPSPHLLRKSSTFTGLDFAAPKKFRDADTMSDAGSIRSNRSGISNAQLSAIRGGAGRVSRLPGDTVFTQASFAEQLKPSWDMTR